MHSSIVLTPKSRHNSQQCNSLSGESTSGSTCAANRGGCCAQVVLRALSCHLHFNPFFAPKRLPWPYYLQSCTSS
jgi:hypothetical protein